MFKSSEERKAGRGEAPPLALRFTVFRKAAKMKQKDGRKKQGRDRKIQWQQEI
jgi:hypothetical protein